MEEVIKAIEKIYGTSDNQVAVIDPDANVVWCNEIQINRVEKLKVGTDLSKVARTIFWGQAKTVLERGKPVQMIAMMDEQRCYLFIEPFINERLVYSIVHFTDQKAVYDLATAKIVHDLKNPINMMLMLSKKMAEKDAGTIKHYCNAALGIINELEIYAEEGEVENKIETLNMTEFIGKIFAECETVLNQKFQVDVQVGDKTLTCRANAKEIENAVVNLVVNAKNHCDSHIKLELYEKNGCAVIAVENDGDKVDESIRDTMYEPCVKANSSGSGLGLYTVKTVAEKHCGDICLVEGDNTRFELSIPLAVVAQVRNSDEYPVINADYIRYELERSDG